MPRLTIVYVLVLAASFGLPSTGIAQGAPAKKSTTHKPAPASPSASQSQIVKVSNYYCDTSVPYVFTEGASGNPISVDSKKFGSAMTPKGTPQEKVDDPIKDFGGKSFSVYDPGGSILGDKTQELGADGFDAARLLIRTLQAASTSYPSTQLVSADCHLPPTNQIVPPATMPAFSFSKATFYLIEIVRWKISNGINQIDSDDWYMMNYSDSAPFHRTMDHMFQKFSPGVGSELRIFGDAHKPAKNQVYFLSIHLAPQGGVETNWVDKNSTAISYKIQADKVGSIGVQDFSALFSAIVGPTPGEKTFMGRTQKPPAPAHKPSYQGLYGAALLTNLSKLPVMLTPSLSVTFGPVNTSTNDSYCAPVDKSLLSSAAPATPSLCPALMPIFNPSAGTYAGAQQVTITDLIPGLKIYYTTDGSDPNPPSDGSDPTPPTAVYSQPIAVASSETLKAIATAPDYSQSTVATAAYTITAAAPPPASPPSATLTPRLPDALSAKLALASYSFGTRYIAEEQTGTGGSKPTTKPVTPATGADPTTQTGINTKTPPATTPQTSAPTCDTSTQTDASGNTVQKPCSITGPVIADEGLDWWDISVAVPTIGYKQTSFDSNNALQPKSETVTNAYALLDFAPWGEDFVTPRLWAYPHIITGLPLSGKVFDKPLVGGLAGDFGILHKIPYFGALSVRPFFGVVYNKEFRTSAQTPHWVWKGQYGIEISVTNFVSAIKGKSNGTTGNSTAGGSTQTSGGGTQ